MATVLFVGGVQTACVGMLGEYLGRAYLKINGKPQFVIRETTDGSTEHDSANDRRRAGDAARSVSSYVRSAASSA